MSFGFLTHLLCQIPSWKLLLVLEHFSLQAQNLHTWGWGRIYVCVSILHRVPPKVGSLTLRWAPPCHLRPVFLTPVDTQQCLVMFVLSQLGWGRYWHLVFRGKDTTKYLTMYRTAPYSAQHIQACRPFRDPALYQALTNPSVSRTDRYPCLQGALLSIGRKQTCQKKMVHDTIWDMVKVERNSMRGWQWQGHWKELGCSLSRDSRS